MGQGHGVSFFQYDSPIGCTDSSAQPFEQITALTDVPEGTIVRVITRLDETCREVRDAARVIGDAALFQKMEDAQVKIKRDSEYFFYVVLQPDAHFK